MILSILVTNLFQSRGKGRQKILKVPPRGSPIKKIKKTVRYSRLQQTTERLLNCACVPSVDGRFLTVHKNTFKSITYLLFLLPNENAYLPWWRPVHGLAGPVDLRWGRRDRGR